MVRGSRVAVRVTCPLQNGMYGELRRRHDLQVTACFLLQTPNLFCCLCRPKRSQRLSPVLQGIVGPALGVAEVAKLLQAVAGAEANSAKQLLP